ncbi:MAG: MerR family transcriptional regulator [Chthonomonas sp.]|nr:MerR family transcriptional regulator [Chthonomonas sp.]
MDQREESLGIGLYSVSDAARLLRTPSATLWRWVRGYVQELRTGPKQYSPVLAPKAEPTLSFGDLVELMYVREFRRIGIKLDLIRQVANRYRSEWDVDYPFATQRFAVGGRELLTKENEEWRGALSGQAVLFATLGKQLVHLGDFTSEWRPLGASHAVLVTPTRAFGKPIDDTSGTHTFVLASAVLAGETPAQVSWFYGTTANAVKDAVEFERGLVGHVSVR